MYSEKKEKQGIFRAQNGNQNQLYFVNNIKKRVLNLHKNQEFHFFYFFFTDNGFCIKKIYIFAANLN